MELDHWYEPGPEPPYFCCHSPTWSWHNGEMYCEGCGRDIPLRSGRECDAHIRARFGLPQLPPQPATFVGDSEYLRFSKDAPCECPACDEPVASEQDWDEEYGVCRACATAHDEEDAVAADEFAQSFDDEDPDSHGEH